MSEVLLLSPFYWLVNCRPETVKTVQGPTVRGGRQESEPQAVGPGLCAASHQWRTTERHTHAYTEAPQTIRELSLS